MCVPENQVIIFLLSQLILFILMNFPILIDTISMGYPFYILGGLRLKFQNFNVFLSLKIVFILANSADPLMKCPIMPHHHLGLNCQQVPRMKNVKSDQSSYCFLPFINPV